MYQKMPLHFNIHRWMCVYKSDYQKKEQEKRILRVVSILFPSDFMMFLSGGNIFSYNVLSTDNDEQIMKSKGEQCYG